MSPGQAFMGILMLAVEPGNVAPNATLGDFAHLPENGETQQPQQFARLFDANTVVE